MTLANGLLLTLLVLPGVAIAQASLPTLTISDCTGTLAQEQERVCLPVELHTAGAAVASSAFTLEYDLAVARMPGGSADVVPGAALTGGQNVTVVVNEAGPSGLVRVLVAPGAVPIPTISDGVLVEVCLTVQTGASGCSPVRFVSGTVDLGSDGAQNLPMSTPSDGGICVSENDTVEDGIGDTCECGDFNGDGLVNTVDASLIQRCSVGTIPCSGLCDVNGDGDCSVVDARLIQRLAVGELAKEDLTCEERP